MIPCLICGRPCHAGDSFLLYLRRGRDVRVHLRRCLERYNDGPTPAPRPRQTALVLR